MSDEKESPKSEVSRLAGQMKLSRRRLRFNTFIIIVRGQADHKASYAPRPVSNPSHILNEHMSQLAGSEFSKFQITRAVMSDEWRVMRKEANRPGEFENPKSKI